MTTIGTISKTQQFNQMIAERLASPDQRVRKNARAVQELNFDPDKMEKFLASLLYYCKFKPTGDDLDSISYELQWNFDDTPEDCKYGVSLTFYPFSNSLVKICVSEKHSSYEIQSVVKEFFYYESFLTVRFSNKDVLLIGEDFISIQDQLGSSFKIIVRDLKIRK